MNKVFASIFLAIVLATPAWAFDDLAPVTMKKLIDANHLEAGLGRIYLEEKLDTLTDKVDAIPIAVPMQLHMDEMDSFNTLLTHAEERIHLLQVALDGLSQPAENKVKILGVTQMQYYDWYEGTPASGNYMSWKDTFKVVGLNLIDSNTKVSVFGESVTPLAMIENIGIDFRTLKAVYVNGIRISQYTDGQVKDGPYDVILIEYDAYQYGQQHKRIGIENSMGSDWYILNP